MQVKSRFSQKCNGQILKRVATLDICLLPNKPPQKEHMAKDMYQYQTLFGSAWLWTRWRSQS